MVNIFDAYIGIAEKNFIDRILTFLILLPNLPLHPTPS
jgi:hypothetical protein